jgi:glycosyltransferase involved in cell wall biosynthesis
MTEHPPKSYSPSSERILHAALAGGSIFHSVIVLSLRGSRKRDQRGQTERLDNRVLLKAVNFVRGMLYPFVDILDPIKLLVFIVHGFALSKRYKPSCIFASMPPLETGLSAWLLSKIKGSTFVIDLRDDWESAMGTQLKLFFPTVIFKIVATIINKVYSSAMVIFAATQTIADTIKKRGINTQTVLVPNGADTSVFIPQSESFRERTRMRYNLPLDKVVAVYCGTGIILYYRLDQILASVRFLSQEVKERIFIVFYVYDGAEKLRHMQKELGITDTVVEIRDPLPRQSLAEVLAASDVGLIPFDDKEYLLCARSTKLYEYLSSGLCVVCSGPKGGELDTLFSAYTTLGLFIHPSAYDFAFSLEHILKNEDDWFSEDMRKFRHSFIKGNYDRNIVMKRAMKALVDCVQCNVNLSRIQSRDANCQ